MFAIVPEALASTSHPERPDAFSAIAFTNFGHHFGTNEEIARPCEGLVVLAERPAIPLPNAPDCVSYIGRSFLNYPRIPREV